MKTENEFLSVSVNPKGGALTSVFDKSRNTELLYQPIPESWSGQDVFIFPFVARLKNGKYTLDGKEYEFKNHGLIRYMTGEESLENGDIVVRFHDDESTKARYPFSFEAKAVYHLEGKTLTVSYIIRNTDTKVMPFMVGGHPAFRIPGTKTEEEFDISGNYVQFERCMPLTRITQEETFSFCTGEAFFINDDRLQLSKRLFDEINTIILKADGFEYVDLHKKDGTQIRVHKKSAEFLALWTQKWGDYIAIEPWDGIPDKLDGDSDFFKKKAVRTLAPGEEYVFSYAVEVIK